MASVSLLASVHFQQFFTTQLLEGAVDCDEALEIIPGINAIQLLSFVRDGRELGYAKENPRFRR